MSRTKKEIRTTTIYWVIGTLVVLGLIWWWAAASIEENKEEEGVETEEIERVENSYLDKSLESRPAVLLIPDFQQV